MSSDVIVPWILQTKKMRIEKLRIDSIWWYLVQATLSCFVTFFERNQSLPKSLPEDERWILFLHSSSLKLFLLHILIGKHHHQCKLTNFIEWNHYISDYWWEINNQHYTLHVKFVEFQLCSKCHPITRKSISMNFYFYFNLHFWKMLCVLLCITMLFLWERYEDGCSETTNLEICVHACSKKSEFC